jgi:hypothetical protein
MSSDQAVINDHCIRGRAEFHEPYDSRQAMGLTRRMSGCVQMLWGERRGRATFGAVQPLPMELPMSHQDYHFDASRSLTASSRMARSSP